MAYTTPAECKALSALAEVAAKTDPQLEALIARAELIINAYTKNNFNARVDTIRVSGTGSTMLMLPERLAVLTKVDFLSLDDGGTVVLAREEIKDVFNRNWYLISDFNFEAPRSREAFGQFPSTEDNIEITGTFGYTAVPDEVKNATCLMVERIVAEEADTKGKSSIFKSEKIGDYRYEKFDQTEIGSDAKSLIPVESRVLLRNFFKPIRPRVPRRKIR